MDQLLYDPTQLQLDHFQRQAVSESRACIVSALISNKHEQLFFQKRSAKASLFPNCWDVVGGHVEPGESLEQALSREVKEETGWSLLALNALLHVFDWQVEQKERLLLKREFAFLVKVQGDLERPALEPKFSAYRWLSELEIGLLKEHRHSADTAIYNLARLAFQAA